MKKLSLFIAAAFLMSTVAFAQEPTTGTKPAAKTEKKDAAKGDKKDASKGEKKTKKKKSK